MGSLVELCVKFLSYFAAIIFDCASQGNHIQAFLLFSLLMVITILITLIFAVIINYIIMFIVNCYKTHSV